MAEVPLSGEEIQRQYAQRDLTEEGSGRIFRIGRLIAAGGEGAVFEVPGAPRPTVIKILPYATAQDEEKTGVMIDNFPQDFLGAPGEEQLIWPTQRVYEATGFGRSNYRGFEMPAVKFRNLKTPRNEYTPYDVLENLMFLYSLKHRIQLMRAGVLPADLTWRYNLEVALSLAQAFNTLHRRAGVTVGDVNEKNMGVRIEQRKIVIWDPNAMQIRAINGPTKGKIYPASHLMRTDYKALELTQLPSLRGVTRMPNQDSWSLNLIEDEIIMDGDNPANLSANQGRRPSFKPVPGSGHNGEQDWDTINNNTQSIASPFDLPYHILRRPLASVLTKNHIRGYDNPSERSAPYEVAEAVQDQLDHLVHCNSNHGNNNHEYSDHLDQCPFCEVVQKSGGAMDYYPTI